MQRAPSLESDSLNVPHTTRYSAAAIIALILGVIVLFLVVAMAFLHMVLKGLLNAEFGTMLMAFPAAIAVLGLICGILGCIRTGRGKRRGRGLSVAGGSVSVVGLIFSVSAGILLSKPPVFEETGGYRIFCTVGYPGEQIDDSVMRDVCRILKKRIDPDKRVGIAVIASPYDNHVVAIAVPAQKDGQRIHDDPENLKRMLKGSGTLEFRVLPTRESGDLSKAEIESYIARLAAQGPQSISPSNYVWCEIENADEWKTGSDIVTEFDGKKYALASNKADQVMLRTEGAAEWKLPRARATEDQQGRRAIGFSFDEKGGILFGELTLANLGRPLCILLDGLAVSAPTIQDRITREGVITARFSQQEQEDIVNKLNAGCLPVPVQVIPGSLEWVLPTGK